MSGKFLGPIVAGAALGGVALLLASPRTAEEKAGPEVDLGLMFSRPGAVGAGERVTLFQLCAREQRGDVTAESEALVEPVPLYEIDLEDLDLEDRGAVRRQDPEGDFPYIYVGEGTAAPGTAPGPHIVRGTCGVGEIVVAPSGPVPGGAGGDSGDAGLAAEGSGLLATAVLTGAALLRRRRTSGTAV